MKFPFTILRLVGTPTAAESRFLSMFRQAQHDKKLSVWVNNKRLLKLFEDDKNKINLQTKCQPELVEGIIKRNLIYWISTI